MCLEYYEIDPCYTYSTPGLTWLCGLKYTNVRLKYYKENTVNIYDTIQHGIRGGLASVLGDCHVKCLNKQIDPEYAVKENYLKYLDFNSLYASAMVQALPTGEIKVCVQELTSQMNWATLNLAPTKVISTTLILSIVMS